MNNNTLNDIGQNKWTPKITWKTKIGYSLGSVAEVVSDDFISAFTLFFLTDAAGLEPVFAALIISISVYVGAVSDVLSGPISDKVKGKPGVYGRRFPFMLGAVIPLIASGIFMFTAWDSMPEMGKNVYYTITILVYWVSYSMFQMPYYALGATFSLDDSERTQNRVFAMIFQYITYFCSTAVPTALVAFMQGIGLGLADSWHWVAFVLIGVAGICELIYIFSTRKSELDFTEIIEKAEKKNIFVSFIECLKMKPLRNLMYATLLFRIPYGMTSALTLYFFLYSVRVTEAEISVYYTTASLSGVAFAIILYKLAGKLDNRKVLIFGTFFMGVWVACFGFIPMTAVWIIVVYALFRQVGSTIYWTYIIPVMYPCNEIDEFRTGQRREGTIISLYGFTQKVGYGLSVFVAGLVLNFTQYDASLAVQSEFTINAIRLWYTCGVGAFIILTGFLLLRYPVNKDNYSKLVSQLNLKREGKEYNTDGFEELLK